MRTPRLSLCLSPVKTLTRWMFPPPKRSQVPDSEVGQPDASHLCDGERQHPQDYSRTATYESGSDQAQQPFSNRTPLARIVGDRYLQNPQSSQQDHSKTLLPTKLSDGIDTSKLDIKDLERLESDTSRPDNVDPNSDELDRLVTGTSGQHKTPDPFTSDRKAVESDQGGTRHTQDLLPSSCNISQPSKKPPEDTKLDRLRIPRIPSEPLATENLSAKAEEQQQQQQAPPRCQQQDFSVKQQHSYEPYATVQQPRQNPTQHQASLRRQSYRTPPRAAPFICLHQSRWGQCDCAYGNRGSARQYQYGGANVQVLSCLTPAHPLSAYNSPPQDSRANVQFLNALPPPPRPHVSSLEQSGNGYGQQAGYPNMQFLSNL